MAHPAKNTFIGEGGVSARAGFLFALGLAPTVMLALGVLEILEHYGAIRAAHKLMTPLLKPILGIPGLTGLAMITDLQSTDAGAAITKDLYDNNLVNRKELTIMTAWQYSGAGMINNRSYWICYICVLNSANYSTTYRSICYEILRWCRMSNRA